MDEKLMHFKSEESYGKNFQAHLLEQYKVVRSAITDLQNDRNIHNNFYLVILTGLVTVLGFSMKYLPTQNHLDLKFLLSFFFTILSILSIAISVIWIRLNKSFKKALRVRYGFLKKYEVELPSRPFTKEHKYRKKHGYLKVSDVAICLAYIFIMINFLFLIGLLIYIT